jgi:hypothetical protein
VQGRDSGDGNQGEGNREADRRYREKASEFARSPRAADAAEEARRALGEGELGSADFEYSSLDHEDGDFEREQPSDRDVEREQPSRTSDDRR